MHRVYANPHRKIERGTWVRINDGLSKKWMHLMYA
jgi:hypothetical protein